MTDTFRAAIVDQLRWTLGDPLASRHADAIIANVRRTPMPPDDPFADPRGCIKCGHVAPVLVNWHQNQDCSRHLMMDEHLDLVCRRCGWSETADVLNLTPTPA